jgi:hypothetical protein
MTNQSRIVSKKRVTDHGEVHTGQREVQAMLDLVRHETERVDSRFLEPACGDGNFLAEVLKRKLAAVEQRYGRSQTEYERYAVQAVCSIYGIDILQDNVYRCRDRLLAIFEESYARLWKEKVQARCVATVRHVLGLNIIWGDALTLRTVGHKSEHIFFAEWSPVNGNLMKRRDFSFRDLLAHQSNRELPLFSDLGEEVFVPTPENEYPPVNFLELADG